MKRGFLLLLLFPILGFAGMVLILVNTAGNGNQARATSTMRQFPTPVPVDTTPVPTVIIVPILDNPAPQNVLTSLEGDSFTLADSQGEIVIVNFWATWCTPCVKEMPFLNQYAMDHPEIRVLAVTDPDDGQDLELIEDFISELELNALDFGLDQGGFMKGMFRAVRLPMTFVIDQEGIVRFRQIGEVTREHLDYYIDELS